MKRSFSQFSKASPGSDVSSWTPTDYKEDPLFLVHVKDPAFKTLGAAVNKLWLSLGKQVRRICSCAQDPPRHLSTGLV